MPKFVLTLSIVSLSGVFVIGCGSSQPKAPPITADSRAQQKAADQQILNQVQALDPSQRRQYIAGHSREMRALMSDPDPEIQAGFRKIMGGQ